MLYIFKACTMLDGSFLYLTTRIPSTWGCVAYNLWPWPISSRSFSHDFAIKLLKYGTSCCVCSTAYMVLDVFFHIWHKWSLAFGVVYNKFWPSHISSRSNWIQIPMPLLSPVSGYSKDTDYRSNFQIFHFREIFMFYCPNSLFCCCPITKIDFCVIW